MNMLKIVNDMSAESQFLFNSCFQGALRVGSGYWKCVSIPYLPSLALRASTHVFQEDYVAEDNKAIGMFRDKEHHLCTRIGNPRI